MNRQSYRPRTYRSRLQDVPVFCCAEREPNEPLVETSSHGEVLMHRIGEDYE